MSSVLFRCDASPTLGAGHVMRCLALAETFAQFGWKSIFAINPDARKTMSALVSSGHELVDVRVDTAATNLSREDTKVVVIDHYGYDLKYERQFAGAGRAVVVFDDLANRPHDCDILVDPTPERRHSDYARFVPKSCRLMLGPENAIVRSGWRGRRAATLARLRQGNSVKRVVVSMGATDPVNATGRVMDAIAKSSFNGHVDVVLGGGAPHIDEISKQCNDRTVLHIEPKNLCEIVSCADLAIGASGSSSFERAVLGLPSLMIPTADNQRYMAASFSALGAAEILLATILDDTQALANAIDALIDDVAARVKMTAAAAAMCDGRGAHRVLTAIAGSVSAKDTSVCLRLAEQADAQWLLNLQKQPATRRYARNRKVPDLNEHTIWFEQVLNDPDRLLAIVVAEDARVGMVRLDRIKDTTFEVSIAIGESFHGRGFGGAALTLLRRLASGADLTATVQPENAASIALFATAGYEHCDNGLYLSRAAS